MTDRNELYRVCQWCKGVAVEATISSHDELKPRETVAYVCFRCPQIIPDLKPIGEEVDE